MLISIIVAAAENGVIGSDGGLPWRIPSDLKRFRAMTMGKPVVMGRKTFLSLPKALDGRDNIVVTRDRDLHAPGAMIAPDLSAALELACARAGQRGVDEIMVIGGGEIYQLALPLADRLYLTVVGAEVEGDTLFPSLGEAAWVLEEEEHHPADERHSYPFTFRTYRRLRQDD